MSIGHSTWKVKWSRKAVAAINTWTDLPGGICSQRHMTIAVEPLPDAPVLEREVMLHELLHACLMATSIDWPEKREEAFVQAMSPVLLKALRDNPALVRYLLS